MSYGLPKTVEIDGEELAIRYDYRVILDIFEILNDPDFNDQERALAVLQIFYVEFDQLTDYDAAIQECFRFINGGREEISKQKQPQLISWKHDFSMIVAPINRVLGYEVRAKEYDPQTNTGGVHWWTWLGATWKLGTAYLHRSFVFGKKERLENRWIKQTKSFIEKTGISLT